VYRGDADTSAYLCSIYNVSVSSLATRAPKSLGHGAWSSDAAAWPRRPRLAAQSPLAPRSDVLHLSCRALVEVTEKLWHRQHVPRSSMSGSTAVQALGRLTASLQLPARAAALQSLFGSTSASTTYPSRLFSCCASTSEIAPFPPFSTGATVKSAMAPLAMQCHSKRLRISSIRVALPARAGVHTLVAPKLPPLNAPARFRDVTVRVRSTSSLVMRTRHKRIYVWYTLRTLQVVRQRAGRVCQVGGCALHRGLCRCCIPTFCPTATYTLIKSSAYVYKRRWTSRATGATMSRRPRKRRGSYARWPQHVS
jgi:hypothetical protein